MLLAAGCGGGEEQPEIRRELAHQLALSSELASADLEARAFCDARTKVLTLQEGTIAAINSGRIPAELQEELLASVNALLEGITCTPPAAADGAAEEAQDLAEWLRERAA